MRGKGWWLLIFPLVGRLKQKQIERTLEREREWEMKKEREREEENSITITVTKWGERVGDY